MHAAIEQYCVTHSAPVNTAVSQASQYSITDEQEVTYISPPLAKRPRNGRSTPVRSDSVSQLGESGGSAVVRSLSGAMRGVSKKDTYRELAVMLACSYVPFYWFERDTAQSWLMRAGCQHKYTREDAVKAVNDTAAEVRAEIIQMLQRDHQYVTMGSRFSY